MVKSLVELCTAVCLRNIKDIDDMGSIPYSIARPIVTKIDNAVQLRRIEVNSPHLEIETVECWKRLIKRDFPIPAATKNYVPRNPRSWHKIYAKYHREDAEAKENAREKLKNAFNKIEQDKGHNVSKVVTYDSRKLPRLPRDVKPQVGMRARSGRSGPDQSELRFTGGSRTKTNTPKSVLKRAMREAKEISARNRLNTLTGTAQVKPGQIVRAPVGMVQEKINKARPLTGIRPPTYRSGPSAREQEIEDREARLQKAKETSLRKGSSYVSDEDLDDFEIEGEDGPIGLDVDDLENFFDERETSPKARPSGPGTSSGARGSGFARKMGGSSMAPSTTRAPTRTQGSPKSTSPQKESAASSSRSLGPTSLPPKPAPSSSSAPPGSGALVPRKRKAVDIFMKPKPKVPRP
ncbi:RNA polymerase II transcription factor SIII subunit A-domain-containing protein [Xylaria cubensis]|nr:RNA polymerase II transcription factor SIII subunit A-domain-containing protein [Xylaria cubensis]